MKAKRHVLFGATATDNKTDDTRARRDELFGEKATATNNPGRETKTAYLSYWKSAQRRIRCVHPKLQARTHKTPRAHYAAKYRVRG